MDTATLTQMLRERHANTFANRWRWVYLENVRNETGFMHGKKRFADALAMDLWPSKGLDLHGFEIKVSRADFLHEVRDPDKASAVKRFCDRWWLVIPDPEIVRNGGVPDDWGILCMNSKGTKLRVKKQAPELKPEPLSRGFLASLMRNRHQKKSVAIEESEGADNG